MVRFSPGIRSHTRMTYVRRRLQLLDIALSTIEMTGTASLKLGDIAKKANITSPAVYRYFANVDILIFELREHFFYKEDICREISDHLAKRHSSQPVGVTFDNSIYAMSRNGQRKIGVSH
ncbi:TetR/AcrR family transcriptional regulator [Sphingomonas faeni]|uniref:TetR/AcrR family transcriptional regulator n=1 Tax=Sphingomonas faeni TaxID=185950 RepID=UPI000D3B59EB